MFNGKSDRDGSDQPVLCISSRGNKRLAFFDEEEVEELIRVSDRISDYMKLWKQKADKLRDEQAEQERRAISSDDRIGVEI